MTTASQLGRWAEPVGLRALPPPLWNIYFIKFPVLTKAAADKGLLHFALLAFSGSVMDAPPADGQMEPAHAARSHSHKCLLFSAAEPPHKGL